MVDVRQIREHMEVVDKDGAHVGTVDSIENNCIKLTRSDSGDGRHHYVATPFIAKIETDKVILSRTAAEVLGQSEPGWDDLEAGPTISGN